MSMRVPASFAFTKLHREVGAEFSRGQTGFVRSARSAAGVALVADS
jgi:hypothetical protein